MFNFCQSKPSNKPGSLRNNKPVPAVTPRQAGRAGDCPAGSVAIHLATLGVATVGDLIASYSQDFNSTKK